MFPFRFAVEEAISDALVLKSTIPIHFLIDNNQVSIQMLRHFH